MLHQLSFKLLNGLFGIAWVKSKTLMILLVSMLLTACGSSDTKNEKLPEPGPDGVNPEVSNLVAVNKCNYTKSVGLDNTILFNITGSESLMKPTVTILGEKVLVTDQYENWSGEVEVAGQHKSWAAEFVVSGPESVDADLKAFISEFADDSPSVEEITYSLPFSQMGGADLARSAPPICENGKE